MWQRGVDFVLDTIFPIECLGCNKAGEWICAGCARKIPLSPQTVCLVCKAASPQGDTCFSCQKEFPLARLARFFDYDQPLIRQGIQLAKYSYIKKIFEHLVQIVSPHVRTMMEYRDIDPRALTFVPVPLHPRRYRQRGFNQAELIGQGLAAACETTCVPLLKRRYFTLAQADLDESDRKINLKHAFVPTDPAAIHDKYVVLVDDVTTTGSTLAECARVLQRAGASEIWGLVLAKG